MAAPDIRRIEQAIEPILAQEAVELVDIKFIQEGPRRILRFYLDKTGGINLDDCEQLSHRIGGYLDAHEDLVPYSYHLEVSSPGMNRVIKKAKDFERFAGHRIKLRSKVPHGVQRAFKGFLKGLEEGKVVLENGDQVDRFAIEEIEEARLDPDIKI